MKIFSKHRQSALAFTALALSSTWRMTVVAEDWPQWRGPNRDGVWREVGVMESFRPGGPKVLWRSPVGRGWSSPIAAAGRVYVTDVEVAGGDAHERVRCFDGSNGKTLWTHKYPAAYPDWALGPNGGGPRATPIVRDGKLFTLGALGRLLCLDAIDGGVVWERDLAKEFQVKEFSGITGSPLIEGDLLILNICGKPNACVVAFDRRSGKEVWRALDDSFTYSSPIVLTADGRKQLIVWSQEAITSLNPDTGAVWWRESIRTPGDMAVSTPVWSDHRLLIGGLMMKLDANKAAASVLWPASKALKQRVLSNTSTALLQGDLVFSATLSGELACFDASDGKRLWETDAVTRAGNGACIHLTANGDSVLLFTDQGDLIRARMTARGYHELGRCHLVDGTYSFNGANRTWAAPAFAERHVFVRNDETLICVDLSVKQSAE